MDITERSREVFGQDCYATKVTDIVIERVGCHEACCRVKIEERHCNARGMAMGGVLYTLGDFAAAVACNSEEVRDGEALQWVSLNASIHYLTPGLLGTTLVADARAVKHGRSAALYRTEIVNPDNGKCVAIVETTMIRL